MEMKYKGVEIHDIPRPQSLTVRHKLSIGEVYKIDGRRRRLVGLYETFARFEDERGMHDCYLYWDLERMLK